MRVASALLLAALAAVALVAGQVASPPPHGLGEAPYERLKATNATYALNPTITYTKYEGKFCTGKNFDVDDHWSQDVASQQCWKKCGQAKACKGPDCHCEGFLKAYDDKDSDALCLPVAKCQALCTKLDDCYAVEMSSNVNEPRCYLQRSDCMYEVWSGKFAANDDWDFYLKVVNVTATCPLGVGAEVSRTGEAGTATLYQQETDKRYVAYTAVYTEPHTRVVWHHSGCGWAVEKDLSGYAPAPAPSPMCEDDYVAANAMFGFVGVDMEKDICVTAKAWSGGGYCEHPVFKRLCAHTCADAQPCTADSNVAAVQYSIVKGTIPAGSKQEDFPSQCAALSCSDAIVMKICPTTCQGSRRLQRHYPEDAAKMTAVFRRELQELTDLHRLRTRRLGVECYNATSGTNQCPGSNEHRFVEVYYTWKPTMDNSSCDVTYSAPNTTLMNVAPLYDVLKFNSPVGVSLDRTCPTVLGYETVTDKLCPHNNVNVSATAGERCWQKCQGTMDRPMHRGQRGWCFGNDATFNRDSNALCLPRGECEKLCNSLGDDCSSIDMHETLPRCYINGPHCTTAVDYRTNVTLNHTDFSLLYKRDVRWAYKSLDNVQCNGTSSETATYDGYTRVQCEKACTAATCTFAEMYNGTCALHNSTCVQVSGVNTTLMYKQDAAPCEVSVSGHWESSTNGVYVDSPIVSGGVEYRKLDNSSRLKWKALGDDTCDGWVLQGNTADKRSVTIQNCSDDNAAAGEFLGSVSSTPCWMAKSKGNCTNRIVAGLCPVTCKGFVSSKIADDMYTYQMTTMAGKNSSCLGDNNAAAFMYSDQLNLNQSVVNSTFFCERNTNTSLCTRFLAYRKLCSATCQKMLNPSRRLLEIEYQDAHSGTWVSQLRTWPNASFASSHYGGVNCSTAGTQAGTANLTYLDADEMFHVETPKADDSEMQYVCRKQAHCPMYTTCHFPHMRFKDEIDGFRGPGMKVSDRFRDIESDHNRYVALYGSRWVPKVIISETRAEAIISPPHWEFGKEVFRSVPGHTRVRVRQYSPEATRVLVSISGAADPWAQYNFNRTYDVPKGYEPWVSDVVRFEVLHNVTGVQSSFAFDIYVPVLGSAFGPKVWRFGDDVNAGPVLEAAVTKTDANDNWYTVVTNVPNADFIVTVDTNECDGKNQCETEKDGGVCINQDASYTCACQSTHMGDGWSTGTQCIIKEQQHFHDSYDHYNDQSFLIYHQTKLENGWRLKKVLLYYDDACSVPGPVLSGSDVETSGTYPTSSKDFLTTASSTSVEWWCDTLGADRDEGTGCWVKVNYRIVNTADGCPQDVKCIKIEQADCDGHHAPEMSIRRGRTGALPSSDGWRGQPDGFAVRGNPGWTTWWSYDTKEQSDTYPVTCGMKEMQVFGELLTPDGFTGVASPCICKQLCMDHIDEGCRSWKFYEETFHCFLQKSVFKGNDMSTSTKKKRGNKVLKGEGWWRDPSDSWKGWVSGYTDPIPLGFRTEPPRPTAGQKFDLIVEGAGFPWDPERWQDLSDRQRMKIIRKSDHCSVHAPPPTVSGIGCTDPRICAPKPTSATRDTLKWTKLSVALSKDESEYKVCYCAGLCIDKAAWTEVPGELEVNAAFYSWELKTTDSETTRTDMPAITTRDMLKLRLSRPSFSSLKARADWRVKMVRDMFTCKHRGDVTICGGDSDCGAPDAATPPIGPDEAEWTNITVTAKTPAGRWQVCFSEDAGATWQAAPSKTSNYVWFETHPDHSTRPRGIYHHTRASLRAGVERVVRFPGYRMWVPAQGRIAVTNDVAGCKSANFSGMYDAVPALSTDTELTFKMLLAAEHKGKYTMCYCDDQTATATAGGGKSYYSVTQDTACANVTSGYITAPTKAAAHNCYTKCNAGCFGIDCHCDGYDTKLDLDATNGALCLSAEKCRDQCEADDACGGYVMHNDKSRCTFVSNVTTCDSTVDVEYDLWTKNTNSSVCAAASDFTATTDAEVRDRTVGVMWVTQKADLDVDYVLPPEEVGSLEITGTRLSHFEDRILVMEYMGVCGLSEPTSRTTSPAKGEDWYTLDAVNTFFDKPHNDTEGAYQPASNLPRVYSYLTKDMQYCPGHNIAPEGHANRLVSNHQCYKKCQMEAPCTDAFCFCDGFLQARDMPDSDALCLSEQQCKNLCNSMDDCFGIDMHRALPRCFLNLAGCRDMVNTLGGSTLAPDDDYNFLVKTEDNNLAGRRMAAVHADGGAEAGTGMGPRELLSALDPGTSWENILRFKPVTFPTGGSFKLCFCDSDLLTGTNICNSPKDFTIEVGTVFSSGIHCLLSDPKLQRGQCVKHFHGGLRCYPDEASVPVVAFPPTFLGVPDPAANLTDADLLQQLSAWCVFGPPEETMNNPMCALRA